MIDLTTATVRSLARAMLILSHMIAVPYDDIIREGTYGSALPGVDYPLVTVWSHDDAYRISAHGWSHFRPF